ncbi:hypothetical protein Tco_0529519 [Tanacetum coccineum]
MSDIYGIVLDILRQKKLYAKFSKMRVFIWLQQSLPWYHILICRCAYIMDPLKVEAIAKWQRPTRLMREGDAPTPSRQLKPYEIKKLKGTTIGYVFSKDQALMRLRERSRTEHQSASGFVTEAVEIPI